MDLHNAVEKEAGGVKCRIVENLHLAHAVQRQAPELLASFPALVQVLEANQLFFEALYDVAFVDCENWNCDKIFQVRNSVDRRIFTKIRMQNRQAKTLAGAAAH